MLVTLIGHTPQPEETVALAARLCYSPSSISDLKEKLDSSDITRFLDKIMSLGHHSVLEHASFTFGIEGISRVTSHQLVRHRIASFSQQSQRYVSHKDHFSTIMPDTIAAHPESKRIFDFATSMIHSAYEHLLELGIPPEDARYLLPNATETKLVMTMNARELRHFFALRCCHRAQWEIREMAIQMLRLCKATAPLIFKDSGPGCLTGPCPEGPFCCGKMAEVREYFRYI